MKIEYWNWEKQVITQQQAQQLQEYQKIYKDDIIGVIKQIDRIENGVIDAIRYYLDVSEDEIAIIQQLSPQAEIVSIILRLAQGTYKTEFIKQYNTSVLAFINEVLLDEYDNIICYRCLDISTNMPIIESTEKFHYDYKNYNESFGGYWRSISANYKSDGTLNNLTVMISEEEEDWEDYNALNVSEAQTDFNEDISYYFNADFLPNNIG